MPCSYCSINSYSACPILNPGLDVNDIAVLYVAGAIPQTLPSSVNTVLNTFTPPVNNIGGIVYTATNGRFTIAVTGRYFISAFVTFDANVVGSRQLYLYRENQAGTVTTLLASESRAQPGGFPTRITLSTFANINSGDRIYLVAWQDSGVPLVVFPAYDANKIVISRIS